MLPNETPFPNVGSYALLIDEEMRIGPGRAELVRIQRVPLATTAADYILVSFPLREGASGNKGVLRADLIDATPLMGAEGKEMVELGRELRLSRVTKRAEKQLRHDALHSRAVWAPHMQRLLAEAARRGAVGMAGRATNARAA